MAARRVVLIRRTLTRVVNHNDKNIQDMKKINFKKTKYVLPAIALPFVIAMGYLVADIFSPKPEADNGLEKSDEFNTSLPKVDADAVEIKTKMQEMVNSYELEGLRRTAIMNVENEEEEKMEITSAYDEANKRMLDSLDAVRNAEMEQLKEMRQARWEQEESFEGRTAQLTDNGQMAQLTEQMRMIQKVANGERILTAEEEEQERQRAMEAEIRRQVADSIAEANAPLPVTRAEQAGASSFNTVEKEGDYSDLIKGKVDELVKVKDGSRLRIRLAEDVDIDGTRVPKGTFLFANVRGFSQQRVQAEVTSVILGGKLRKVSLTIYDIDGQEGFFVPTSVFRDMAKEAGSQAMNMNLNMNSSGNGLESTAMQTLEQTLRSITSAVSSNIRQNKARIKYNTDIYLVDTGNK